MIKIEKNKDLFLFSHGFLAFVLILVIAIPIYFIKTGEGPDVIITMTAMAALELIPGVCLFIVSGRTYELTDAGITMYGVFHFKREFAWDDFPYCYILWTSNKHGVYPLFVFSRTEFDEKRANKYDRNGGILEKPYSVIAFKHTRELEKQIRDELPGLKFVYRNLHLAKLENKARFFN